MSVSLNRTTPRFAAAALAAASLWCLATSSSQAAPAPQAPQVRLADGIVEGMKLRGEHKEVRAYRGIPYAAPPVGDFRFREPQPVPRWAGVLKARQFGPRCMQSPAANTEFRSKEMSEDCLYLNVWTPARGAQDKLPVLVYFHGGGFTSGDGSEPRYDGANLAARGIVAVTVNYRLGVFGFLASPEAARESPHGTAGNYGLLDQVAALRWVRENIAQFGGDPSQVTIAGNSAGSISVSAHMASPVSRGLFARAIGQSGGAFAPNGVWQRADAERAAAHFSSRVGASSVQQLRSLPARALLAASTQPKLAPAFMTFRPHVDGYFLTDTPEQVFNNGGQSQVPLLVGSNSQESHFSTILEDGAPTPENWRKAISARFPDHAEEVLAHYPGKDNDEVMHAGNALASDLLIGHSTWRWMDLHRQTGQAPVYFYRYTHPRPPELKSASESEQQSPSVLGAVHDAQVEYALGNVDTQRQRYAWKAADYDVARMFSSYVEQFVKTGNPNGNTAESGAPLSVADTAASVGNANGVPHWPAVRADNKGLLLQVIGEKTQSAWNRGAAGHGLIQRLVEKQGINNPSVSAQ